MSCSSSAVRSPSCAPVDQTFAPFILRLNNGVATKRQTGRTLSFPFTPKFPNPLKLLSADGNAAAFLWEERSYLQPHLVTEKCTEHSRGSGSRSGGTILHGRSENIDVGFDRIQLEDKRINILNRRVFPACCPEPRPGNGGLKRSKWLQPLWWYKHLITLNISIKNNYAGAAVVIVIYKRVCRECETKGKRFCQEIAVWSEVPLLSSSMSVSLFLYTDV